MLLIESDGARAREVEALLDAPGSRLQTVDDATAAVRALVDDPDVALIVIGAGLVRRGACELVERLRASAGETMLPVLLLTDGDEAASDLEAVFALGAVDEVPRGRLPWALPAKVRFVLDGDARSRLRHERELAQRADALTEAQRRKDAFLATLAHELRSPLAPMRNGLELMRLADGDSEELGSIRQMMSRQLDHLARLVDDLLDVTRLTHDKLVLKRERVDLRTVLGTALETARPFIEAGEHSLTVEIADEPMSIDADPVRIAQTIINLLNNAAKYTPDGGHIRVCAARKCDEVHLSVSDSGIGIPEQALASVFGMFEQVERERTYDGLGVGLALVQRLLALHGGSIDAFSAGPGKGSTFRIRLPRIEAGPPLPTAPAVARRHVGESGPFRILVVDDGADARTTFAKVLERQRHVTRQARDGAEALTVAAEFRPDIVFLDIGLPDVDGRTLAPRLRALPGLDAVVLVALSGYASARDHALSVAAGIDHHLDKPVRIRTVHELLDEIAATLASGVGGIDDGRESRGPTSGELEACIDTPLVALSIADARQPDQPLVCVNGAFTDLTGYPAAEVIGRNCRFLQGRDREQEGRRLLKEAIRDGRDVEVFLHNVKRCGEPFTNLLRLYALRDAGGTVRYLLGSQLEAAPAARPARSLTSAASGARAEPAQRQLLDGYPARLPQRYHAFYDASRHVADEAAARLRELVARS